VLLLLFGMLEVAFIYREVGREISKKQHLRRTQETLVWSQILNKVRKKIIICIFMVVLHYYQTLVFIQVFSHYLSKNTSHEIDYFGFGKHYEFEMVKISLWVWEYFGSHNFIFNYNFGSHTCERKHSFRLCELNFVHRTTNDQFI
jgi:hypothetical protein